jgi:ketosteroid isomerase-like protein
MATATPRDVFQRAHEYLRSYDIRYTDCFAERAVLVMPFAPPGMPRRVEGRDAIRALLEPRYRASRESGRRIFEYRDLRIHDTADPEVVVVEFEALVAQSDETVYELPFILVIRVRDGEIVEQRDDFDSFAAAEQMRVVASTGA